MPDASRCRCEGGPPGAGHYLGEVHAFRGDEGEAVLSLPLVAEDAGLGGQPGASSVDEGSGRPALVGIELSEPGVEPGQLRPLPDHLALGLETTAGPGPVQPLAARGFYCRDRFGQCA